LRSIVFDIECDGLLRAASVVWIAVAVDIETGEEFLFSDHDDSLPSISNFLEFLSSCRLAAGHNILMYDLPVLEKLFKWRAPPSLKVIDTLILSQVLNYKRFGFGHSLARWGKALGKPKPEHEDWSRYSPEMRTRCVEDVRINLGVYKVLLAELRRRKDPSLLREGLKAEHGVSKFVGRAQLHGWPFDIRGAMKLLRTLEAEMEEIANFLEPKLGQKCKAVDSNPEYKSPAWVKNGDYAKRTCEWFGIPPEAGQEGSRPVQGDFCRVEYIDIRVGSTELVKEYLFRIGWVPDDWNYKQVNGRLTKTTPKLTESSLAPLGEIGEQINRFYTIRSRHSILKTWVETDYDDTTGRIYGDSFVIGTPTGRSRHQIIANIPSSDAVYGPEVRALFSTIPGYRVVGADSSSNQNRALCHYLKNKEYTDKVISTDIHTANQEVLTKILGDLGDGGRRKAKAFFVKEYVKLGELLGHPLGQSAAKS
jgi:DNA polymerase-1